jgi:hypothetical protein
MASWKENKMVGVVAGVVAVLFVIMAIVIIMKMISPARPTGEIPVPPEVEETR